MDRRSCLSCRNQETTEKRIYPVPNQTQEEEARLSLTTGLQVWPFLRPFLLGPYRLPDSLTHREVVARLGRLVRSHYPYLTPKGIRWEEAETSALAMADRTTDETALARVLADLLAVLRDGHATVSHDSLWTSFGYTPGLLLRSVGGRVYVDRLAPGVTPAPASDGHPPRELPPPGAEVLTVNGRPVSEALAAAPAFLTAAYPETTRQRLHEEYALVGPKGTEVRFGWRDQDSQGGDRPETVVLRDYGRYWFYPSGEAIAARLIEDGPLPVGYIRVPSFYDGRRGRVLRAQFTEALARVRNSPAMVIDVRGNGGGMSLLAEWVAAHFLGVRVRYASFRCPDGRAISLHVRGRRDAYGGPLILLTDENTGSSAEGAFALPLRRHRPRTWTVGRPTCGNAGNPICVYRYRGIVVRFPGAALVEPDGRTDLELTGLAPDLPVEAGVEDLSSGRDPDLREALRVLGEVLESEGEPCPLRKE
jgi:carboxyl-terminal processing protease